VMQVFKTEFNLHQVDKKVDISAPNGVPSSKFWGNTHLVGAHSESNAQVHEKLAPKMVAKKPKKSDASWLPVRYVDENQEQKSFEN